MAKRMALTLDKPEDCDYAFATLKADHSKRSRELSSRPLPSTRVIRS